MPVWFLLAVTVNKGGQPFTFPAGNRGNEIKLMGGHAKLRFAGQRGRQGYGSPALYA